MIATILTLVCAGTPAALNAEWEVRVGRIIIEGNTQTPDRVVLELLPFCPGEKLRCADLAVATGRIRRCGFFPVNPWRTIGPRVEVLSNELDDTFLDVRIRVNEQPGNWLRYGVRQITMAAVFGDRVELGFAVFSLFQDGRERGVGK